ncbi:MAG: acylphosphatase [Deltaproteobacteria bacterium]|nr:acylphosphatase [Candidatus Anaeroferrophillus wilburensis]MBN2889802.1 acylphosphatase [Deltaproteobacteria bacterium]
MMKKRLQIEVVGRVQGVWFRAHAREEAERLGLTGKVWNAADGSVSIIAEGEQTQLERLLSWCRRGPTLALVTDVVFSWHDFAGEFDRFAIAYD